MKDFRAEQEKFTDVNPEHIELLSASLRAPSAHNAQPWQIRPIGDNRSYELHYDQNDTLPQDIDDKDAYLTMGALVETMALQAPNYGLEVAVTPQLFRNKQDLFIAKVEIDKLERNKRVDRLSQWIGKRVTNRSIYQGDPLSPDLEGELKKIGNVLVATEHLKNIVLEASIQSWSNPRYIADLRTWFRKDNNAEDGITPSPFDISRTDMIALEFAFWRGSLKSRIMGQIYSARDVKIFSSSPQCAVLSVPEMTPAAIFSAGRSLLRSWVTIIAAGYSYQPFSVAVDEKSAAKKVAEIAQVDNPVALYRIGKPSRPPKGYSNRKPLSKVLISRA